MRGLYVHIPFCVSKCSYCDFYSLPGRMDMIGAYIQAVLREAESNKKNVTIHPSFVRRTHPEGIEGELHPQNRAFDTLYIGGGTPSLMGAKHFNQLMDGLNDIFSFTCHSDRSKESSSHPPNKNHQPSLLFKERLRENCCSDSIGGVPLEATIEVNPESASAEFLQAVKNAGFTRISFGVQSLSDDELRSVGRIHSALQAVQAIKLAKQLKFQAISADLIIGLPGQTSDSLHQSLETLVELGVRHLSVYCLSLEEGTILANDPPSDLPTDDMQAKLFEETIIYLKACGFAHYEISNFALPGFECRHNLNYWRGGEYLGLGPAAASHLNGKRFKNRPNLDAYLGNSTGQTEDIEELNAKDKAAEEAMLRLRLLEEGLDVKQLADKFGMYNVQGIITRLDNLVREGSLIVEGTKYRLTPSRILTSNPIFARVLAD